MNTRLRLFDHLLIITLAMFSMQGCLGACIEPPPRKPIEKPPEATPYQDCEILADVGCRRLEECLGFGYEACFERYVEEACTLVEDVNEEPYNECLQLTENWPCEDAAGFPPPICEQAFCWMDSDGG